MCPDRQILSLYLDGELPSPWKEKLEAHLASCPGCREAVGAWERISKELRIEDKPGRGERVWERLGARVAAATAPPRGPREFSGPRNLGGFWRRRVSLPLPALAALGAAAAACVFILGSRWLNPPSAPPSASPFISMDSGGIDMEFRDIPAVMDGTNLFQYLENADSSEIMIIRLPENRSFRSAGEPTIIKAADYYPGRFQE